MRDLDLFVIYRAYSSPTLQTNILFRNLLVANFIAIFYAESKIDVQFQSTYDLSYLEVSLFEFYIPYDYMQEYTFEPFIKLLQGMHYYEKDAHTVKLSDYPN